MLSIAHLIEWYHVTQQLLSIRKSPLARFIPRITGDTIFLQPSMFALTQIHLIFDDSRARLPPEKGGLGYAGPVTTLEGTCKTVLEHLKSDGKHIDRTYGDDEDGNRTDVGFDVNVHESAVGGVVEKMERVGNELKLDATKTPN